MTRELWECTEWSTGNQLLANWTPEAGILIAAINDECLNMCIAASYTARQCIEMCRRYAQAPSRSMGILSPSDKDTTPGADGPALSCQMPSFQRTRDRKITRQAFAGVAIVEGTGRAWTRQSPRAETLRGFVIRHGYLTPMRRRNRSNSSRARAISAPTRSRWRKASTGNASNCFRRCARAAPSTQRSRIPPQCYF